MVRDPNYKPATGGFNLGIAFSPTMAATNLKPTNKTGITGRLKAWDPVARKVVWETPAFTNNRPSGGALATAGGLVFAGNGAGEELRAYDAKSGTQVWSYKAQTAVYAGPITYELDGEQYIAQSVGGVAQGGYYAGRATRACWCSRSVARPRCRPNQPYTPPPLSPPPSTASADVVKLGGEKYSQYCSVCHGQDGVQQRGTFPNLMVSGLLHSQEGFDQVVLQGQRRGEGHGQLLEGPEARGVGRGARIPGFARANILKKLAPPAPPAPASDGNQHQAELIESRKKRCLPRAVFARGTVLTCCNRSI